MKYFASTFAYQEWVSKESSRKKEKKTEQK